DAGAGAAVLGRDAQAEQAGVPEQLEEVLRVLAGLVDLARPRLDFVLAQPTDSRLQLGQLVLDRKSTRLNSSHVSISYAVFCLKTLRPSEICPLSLHDALPI